MLNHAVHCITSTATYTNNFYCRQLVHFRIKFQHFCSSYCTNYLRFLVWKGSLHSKKYLNIFAYPVSFFFFSVVSFCFGCLLVRFGFLSCVCIPTEGNISFPCIFALW